MMALFQLDDDFLVSVGLASMPPIFRKPFLQHVYDTLEVRVGTNLGEGMTDSQLEEFEAIIDQNEGVVDEWIASNVPNYVSDEIYVRLAESAPTADESDLRAEFVATKWLAVNRPDYREVVARTLNELRREIAEVVVEILASIKLDPPVAEAAKSAAE
jgi:hypothetical protein